MLVNSTLAKKVVRTIFSPSRLWQFLRRQRSQQIEVRRARTDPFRPMDKTGCLDSLQPPKEKNDVTYAAFGIDPVEFYSTRFSSGKFDAAGVSASINKTLGWDKFSILENFIGGELEERSLSRLNVLDLGCGSGRLGAWLYHRFPGKLKIFGIDMSEACVANALANGYTGSVAHDFLTGLPYPDSYFDVVFSMDVFGHIEFRHKDNVIRELKRVTKLGGRHIHGIETGSIGYVGCNPSDVNDVVRQYVYIDGHIGVETLDENVIRFGKQFGIKEAYPWLIRPILETGNVINNKLWTGYSDALEQADTEMGRVLADIFGLYYNTFFRDLLRKCFGPIQTEAVLLENTEPGPLRDFIVEICKGSGFSFLVLEKL